MTRGYADFGIAPLPVLDQENRMTHEQRAKWIKWIFLLLLSGGIIVGVFLYSDTEEVIQPVQIPENGLQIVLYEDPAEHDSKELGKTLDGIQKKYDELVIVTHVDFEKHPKMAKAAGVTKPPHVVMIAKSGPVFDFQGLWSREKVELKVDEILRGLKRFSKDWRPAVKGMQPAPAQS